MMLYKVKLKNKFPYICYISTDASRYYSEINPWVKKNIGVYNSSWTCSGPHWNVYLYYPYAFKNEEDAMAFKLRWEE